MPKKTKYKQNNNKLIIIIIIIIIILLLLSSCIGGYFYYKSTQNKTNKSISTTYTPSSTDVFKSGLDVVGTDIFLSSSVDL